MPTITIDVEDREIKRIERIARHVKMSVQSTTWLLMTRAINDAINDYGLVTG